MTEQIKTLKLVKKLSKAILLRNLLSNYGNMDLENKINGSVRRNFDRNIVKEIELKFHKIRAKSALLF
jgi:uncharacterized protein YutE (UPF0331/DUF86 family)